MRLASRSLARLSACLLLTGLSTVALASGPSASTTDSGDLPVRYDVRASFDPHLRRISGIVEIALTNRTASPVPRLSFLLYPKLYKDRPPEYDEGRLDEIYSMGFSAGWIEVTDLSIHLAGRLPGTPEGKPIFIPRLRPSLAATVPLPRELAPGDSASVRMRFTTQLPTKRGPFGFWKERVTIQGGWYPIILPLDVPNPVPDLPLADASHRVALHMPKEWTAVLSGTAACRDVGPSKKTPLPIQGGEGQGEGVLRVLKKSPLPIQGGEGEGEGVLCETLHEPGSTTSMALFKGRPSRPEAKTQQIVVGDRLGESAHRRMAERLEEAEGFLKKELALNKNHAPVSVVEGQLIQTLSKAGDGLLFVSPRIYQAFSWLQPFHDRDLVATYFEIRMGQIFPGRPAWSNELVAADLAESFFAEREIKNLKDLAGPFAFIPIVDRLIYSPEIPLRGLYFGEQIGESKPEDIRTIGSRRLPGRILYQKLRDFVGSEKADRAIRGLRESRIVGPERMMKQSPLPLPRGEGEGEGVKQAADFIGPHPNPLPEGEGAKEGFQHPSGADEHLIRHLSRDAGVPLEDFFTQWLDRPTPSDYSLSPIIPPAGDMPGRIEIRRTAGPWEPLLARARFSDRTIDWWLSGKETETILPLAPGEVPRWVQLDPDQRLSDPDVANNRRPEEWKTLLSRFGARYDFQSRELEYNLSLVATPVYRRDRRLALNLFREEQSSGIRLEYGTNVWKNPAGDLRYDLAVRAGWEKLRKGFGEGDGGNEPLPGPRSDVPLIFSIERTRDGGGSIGLDAEGSSRAVGSSVSYLRGQVAAKREWRIGPYEAVAGRVIFGSASSGIPDQKKFSLGGLEGARGFSKSEILGRQIVLGTGEYRVPIHEDVGLDLLGLLVVDRVQLALFGDAGAATESFDDLGRIGSYRYDLGVGFRMHAAWAGIMPAVLRLDAAYPIGPQNAAGGEPPRRRIHWYLSVGQSF